MGSFTVWKVGIVNDRVSVNSQLRVFSYDLLNDDDRNRALKLAQEFALKQHEYSKSKNEDHIYMIEEYRFGAYKQVMKFE